MKIAALFLLALAIQTLAADLAKLSVVYVGDPRTPRAAAFKRFLQTKVAQFEVTSRKAFDPTNVHGFDVVLLDWPQSETVREEWERGRSPLGDRAQWQKPTVLLGSAGLNLAVVWKVRGGSG
ncbi:MAG: hypothetical protein L0Z50_38260 [Verrucomicrobiales bacterium]|nr:hypothetical protein [Verrucomicrobiales bacterium]